MSFGAGLYDAEEGQAQIEVAKEGFMFIILAVVLVLLWLCGFFLLHITSFFIHILLIFAVISLIMHFVSGRKA
jgi:flagellar basal body-associated protein FliL